MWSYLSDQELNQHPLFGKRSLNHRTTREVPAGVLFIYSFLNPALLPSDLEAFIGTLNPTDDIKECVLDFNRKCSNIVSMF